MAIKVHNGTAFADVTDVKVHNGTAFERAKEGPQAGPTLSGICGLAIGRTRKTIGYA